MFLGVDPGSLFEILWLGPPSSQLPRGVARGPSIELFWRQRFRSLPNVLRLRLWFRFCRMLGDGGGEIFRLRIFLRGGAGDPFVELLKLGPVQSLLEALRSHLGDLIWPRILHDANGLGLSGRCFLWRWGRRLWGRAARSVRSRAAGPGLWLGLGLGAGAVREDARENVLGLFFGNHGGVWIGVVDLGVAGCMALMEREALLAVRGGDAPAKS